MGKFLTLRALYALACPEMRMEAAGEIVEAALERAREKHPDFERFEAGIEFLSMRITCFEALPGFDAFLGSRMPLDDYLEALYCCVKHGDFTRAWRAELRRRRDGAPLPDEAPAHTVQ